MFTSTLYTPLIAKALGSHVPYLMILLVLVVFVGSALASLGIQTGKASSFYVQRLPGLASDQAVSEMHAGRLEVGSKMGLDQNSSLFFWHFRATQPTNKTIVWFNGGPGCSSMDGALMELGPFRVDSATGELKQAPKGSWTEVANLLFVDQPFGTGFSDPNDSAWVTSLEQAADAVSLFLLEYANIFPEFLATEIILAGESFAGQYIPHIYQSLQRNPEAQSRIHISGLVLINPWIDPANQYLSYVPFIKEHGLLPSSDFPQLDRLQQTCVEALTKELPAFNVPECEQISHYLSTHFVDPQSSKADRMKCHNIYDISLQSPAPMCGMEWPPTLPALTGWLRRSDVRKALHAPLPSEKEDMLFRKRQDDDSDGSWQECSGSVHIHMRHGDIARNFLPSVLDTVPLLLMVGMNDFICNYMGLDRMVKNLEWKGGAGFGPDAKTSTESWGSYTSDRNLAMAHVQNASHMVPYDHLEQSQMVLHEWFHEIGLESDEDYSRHDSSGNNGNNSDNGDGSPEGENEKSGNGSDGNSNGKGSSGNPDRPSQEEIDKAVLAAYKKAGVVALIVVLVVVAILGLIWWFRGHGLSAKGMAHALLHSSSRFSDSKLHDYVPLRDLRRRPSAIPEAEDEIDDFEV